MDIAGDIPGLSIQDLGPGDKKYVIRGINSPAHPPRVSTTVRP